MRHMHTSTTRTYVPGSIVAVRIGLVKHQGLISDRIVAGMPTVISNSKKRGCVAEEAWSEFAGGRQVDLLGYPGRLHPRDVLARARSRIGQPWTPTSNCEHFVAFAHGQEEWSPTLRACSIAGAALLLLVLIRAR